MATLLQLLILAQVCLYARGETELDCSLIPVCSLSPPMIDAFSTDRNAEARFTCPVPSSSQGDLTVTWFISNSTTGPAVELTTSNSPGSMFFTESPNVLVISQVGGRYEGLYSCNVTRTGVPSASVEQTLGCLIVLGRGVFAACPLSDDPGCIDETITVPRGGTGVLDARVTFRNGGSCANQQVRMLRVTRETQPGFVYVCSDLAGLQGIPCNNGNNPRITVVDAGGCSPAAACKFNIFLHLTNFTDSDVDVYTIEVDFDALGDTMQRRLRRRISLQIVPASTTTVSFVEPSSASSTSNVPISTIITSIMTTTLFILVQIATISWHSSKTPGIEEPEALERGEEQMIQDESLGLEPAYTEPMEARGGGERGGSGNA